MTANRPKQPNQIIIYLTLILMLALGLWLRLRFIHTVQLYPDEFVTLLAVQMIGRKGAPVMPSGLFYEHGLLFSYLGFLAALFGPPETWVRYASLMGGMLTLGLTFFVGRRWFSPAVGLIATAGLTIAPTAIHWSGRARMYALLQLLVLLTLWLAYEGMSQNKARLRWAALLTYFSATLTHFAAVTLAPPLATAAVFWRLSGAGKQGTREAEEQRSRGAEEHGTREAEEQGSRVEAKSKIPPKARKRNLKSKIDWGLGIEALALVAILILAFVVKRAGQPKGIEALDESNAVRGVVEVFEIYSDFSFDLNAGWEAIAPFFLTTPALIFTPFAAAVVVGTSWEYSKTMIRRKTGKAQSCPPPAFQPAHYLSVILLITSLEIILLVSPDRRDAKYVFMLLPVLLLLGAQGMALAGDWLSTAVSRRLAVSCQQLALQSQEEANGLATNSQPPAVSDHKLRSTPAYALRPTSYVLRLPPLLIIAFILFLTKPKVETLLADAGDDYETAFAYVKEHWQEGDKIMTGTPAAAAFYLGRNDFYSVQKQGGYDYRILTIGGQAVDRWLAAPVIKTEAALHQTLAAQNVWLVLERWGLQREYYDLPFQQQLLAQTQHKPEAEAQGIFVLRSRPNPQPLKLDPAHPVEAEFGEMIHLSGYTLEPAQPVPGQKLRLTLYWQALTPIAHNYTVFVHLRHPQGGNAAQADHRPLGSLYPTSLWPAGETIRESSDLPIPADLLPGRYELWVGLYLLETGERLPVKNDTSGENAVRLGVVEIVEMRKPSIMTNNK